VSIMEFTTIICSLISVLGTIAVSIISARTAKSVKKSEKKEERRQQESMLSLQMMSATMELSVACCNALCGGTNNGNVKKAWDKAEKAAEAYKEFERKVLAEEIS